ncbi:multicopper oxidase family protein [Geodermatophilus ruber]|uniref:Multicopper oxidase with three cupredoxin domains (Includes cell division protein FtsP and spore coat protein CotA) n=1 Tax=Geodermatophilus ruber TaxID=504800 RepID=A0A1I4BQ93_9ACTN|nr:multicopper oxidase domain-containing protein [Geodermatophilus ruber]SFK70580.1 Multicopper oxidase with three cupredoxin domains (includes cell division protein FtsP and spore coat protein CotA) [Geodermatophilus ruber]
METPNVSRRDVLKLSVAGTAAAALPLQGVLSAATASALPASKMPQPYTAAFKAPPVLEPVVTDDVRSNVFGHVPDDYVPTAGIPHYPGQPITGSAYLGTDYYRITQTNVQVQMIPGMWTKMWSYNRSVPGPTIRSYLQPDPDNPGKKIARRTVMQVLNELPKRHPTLGYVPWTSTHLHGSPSKPQFDGYAGDLTQPGEWKNYQYPNNCTPRTLWYHDHGVHHTAQNVYMGLAAQYHLVDEELEIGLGIPRWDRQKAAEGKPQYEFPLILSDVMFTADGQLQWNDDGASGVYGDVILVNGVPWPNMKVEPRKYRFRVLNGSLSRGYRLRLSNNMPFKVIATDGGFMQFAQQVTTFTIGMAERYEIIIDFKDLKGTKVQLVNDGVLNARDFDHTGKVMQFEVGTRVTSTDGNQWPSTLGDPHPVMTLKATDRAAVRSMRLHRSNDLWKINDTTWDDVVKSNYQNVFATVARDSIEVWDVENSSGGWFHPLHIHLVDFRVLSRNGNPPRPEERGPKDVVYVGENETVRLLMRFEHEDGRYMIHCHNLSHEDHDMMFQYQVGHHDIDCDSINSDPPQPLPAPELVPQQPPAAELPAPEPPETETGTDTSTSGTDATTTTAPTDAPTTAPASDAPAGATAGA